MKPLVFLLWAWRPPNTIISAASYSIDCFLIEKLHLLPFFLVTPHHIVDSVFVRTNTEKRIGRKENFASLMEELAQGMPDLVVGLLSSKTSEIIKLRGQGHLIRRQHRPYKQRISYTQLCHLKGSTKACYLTDVKFL